MKNRFGSIRVFVAALGALILVALLGAGTGCSGGAGGTADPELAGEVSLALMTVPMDVQCIVLTAQGSTRTATRSFDVPPGTPSFFKNVTGMPLGAVTFSASAYNSACMGVNPGSIATWVSDPVVASVVLGVINQVTLEMHRNGDVAVGIDFPNEPSCTANGGACVQSAECCSAICSGGVCSSAAMCFPDGAMCMTSANCCTGNCANGICSPPAMCTPNGAPCMTNATCCSALCTNGVCSTMTTCSPNGAVCATSASCCSSICAAGICSSMAMPTCTDGIKDGMETDVDCGGPVCAPCATGKACVVGTDCTSKTCTNGVCTLAPGACMANIDCVSPPAPSCNGTVFTKFVSPGVCTNGTCSYPGMPIQCPTSCSPVSGCM